VSAAEALDRSAGTFVSGLAAAGIRHVCACPGSRSTPLAIKVAQDSRIRLWMHLDERSAAYFGLGLARALGEPVAILATSGTATANFFPAVVEASLARVPLVVLTADRPHELRDNGAAQTIDQVHLYGSHVRWFFDLPEPDGSEAQLSLLAALAARAVSLARAEPHGPVHLNWPLRDPLVPSPSPTVPVPRVSVRNPVLASAPEGVDELARAIGGAPRGVIVVGPQDDPGLAEAVTALAARVGYPVFADALSGVRCGPHDRSFIIDTFDAFLRGSPLPPPELVLRFGAIPTSRPLQQFIERASKVIVVDPGGWRDPSSLATNVLHVDPVLLCEALPGTSRETDWASTWVELNARARQALSGHLTLSDELFEGGVFPLLANALPEGAILFVGNSMPVRDLDTFLPGSAKALRMMANRGANGIDGVVSSALGASATGVGKVTLVIGDISFYHDLNGLLAARKYGLDLLVVLINNDGGGIFSFLPQAELVSDSFEALFGTPHGLDFRPFVQGYGGTFTRVRDWAQFSAAVDDGLRHGGLNVVEVPTNRAHNVDQHRAVWRAVAEALSPVAV
jgi:2-succinyl-5-enolpyruvyl-6-hydroxy-3-cyclohexene-1-carboxylate synthase